MSRWKVTNGTKPRTNTGGQTQTRRADEEQDDLLGKAIRQGYGQNAGGTSSTAAAQTTAPSAAGRDSSAAPQNDRTQTTSSQATGTTTSQRSTAPKTFQKPTSRRDRNAQEEVRNGGYNADQARARREETRRGRERTERGRAEMEWNERRRQREASQNYFQGQAANPAAQSPGRSFYDQDSNLQYALMGASNQKAEDSAREGVNRIGSSVRDLERARIAMDQYAWNYERSGSKKDRVDYEMAYREYADAYDRYAKDVENYNQSQDQYSADFQRAASNLQLNQQAETRRLVERYGYDPRQAKRNDAGYYQNNINRALQNGDYDAANFWMEQMVSAPLTSVERQKATDYINQVYGSDAIRGSQNTMREENLLLNVYGKGQEQAFLMLLDQPEAQQALQHIEERYGIPAWYAKDNPGNYIALLQKRSGAGGPGAVTDMDRLAQESFLGGRQSYLTANANAAFQKRAEDAVRWANMDPSGAAQMDSYTRALNAVQALQNLYDQMDAGGNYENGRNVNSYTNQYLINELKGYGVDLTGINEGNFRQMLDAAMAEQGDRVRKMRGALQARGLSADALEAVEQMQQYSRQMAVEYDRQQSAQAYTNRIKELQEQVKQLRARGDERSQMEADRIESQIFYDELALSAATVAENSALSAFENLPTWAALGTRGGNVNDPNRYVPQAAQTKDADLARSMIGGHMSDTGRFFYNAIMSWADSTANAAMFGAIGGAAGELGEKAAEVLTQAGTLATMGANAATSKANEILQRGGNRRQAVWGGLIAGAVEAFTEIASVENLIHLKDVGGYRELAQQLLKSFFSEASEEVSGDVLDRIFDNLIMGNLSDDSVAVREYVRKGMSLDQAKKQVATDNLLSALEAGLSGGLSGAMSVGLVGVPNAAREEAYQQEYQEFRQVLQDAGLLPGETGDGAAAGTQQNPGIAAPPQQAEAPHGAAEQEAGGRIATSPSAPRNDGDVRITKDGRIRLEDGRTVTVEQWETDADTKDAVQKLTDRVEDPDAANLILALYQDAVSRGDARAGYETMVDAVAVYDRGRLGFDETQTAEQTQLAPEYAAKLYELGRTTELESAGARQAGLDRLRGKTEFSETGATGRKGSADLSGVNWNGLTKTQKQQVTIAAMYGKALGVDVEFYESKAEGGRYVGAQGVYQDGKIRLDVNAGKNFEGDLRNGILQTMSHELTHFIEDYSPALYDELKSAVFYILNEEHGGDWVEGLIQDKIQRSSGKLSKAGAEAEVVADASEMLLGTSKAAQEAVAKFAQEHRTLAQKIADWLKKFAERVRELIGQTTREEAQDILKHLDRVQELWDNALADAVEAHNEIGSMKKTAQEGGGKFSMRSDTEIEEKNIAAGIAAVNSLVEQAKTSDNPESLVVENAMYRSDIGYIDFRWGTPGTGSKFKHGYGLAHIIEKRNAEGGDGVAVAQKLVEVIAKATEGDEQSNNFSTPGSERIRLYYDGYTAILAKNQEANKWLLTGWKNNETATNAAGEVRDSSDATAATPIRTRRSGDVTVSDTSISDYAAKSNTSAQKNSDRDVQIFTSKEDIDIEISRVQDLIRDIQNAQWDADQKAKSDPRVQEAQKKMWAAEDEKGRAGSLRERVEYKRILKEVKAEFATKIPEGDLQELSQRVKDLKEQREKFMKVTPISKQQYDKLAKHFGTTNDYGVAGFILPDGRMLDFSGKKQYGKDYSGGREIYHNEVGDVLNLNEDTSPRINMVSNGSIRLVPEINGINLSSMPSPHQLDTLRGFIDYYNGNVHIDIDNAAGRTLESFGYYNGTSASKILSDIKTYFETGETPAPQSDLRQFRYSERDYTTPSDTELLMQADEKSAQNDEQRKMLREFKAKERKIEALERKLQDQQDQIKELRAQARAAEKGQQSAETARKAAEHQQWLSGVRESSAEFRARLAEGKLERTQKAAAEQQRLSQKALEALTREKEGAVKALEKQIEKQKKMLEGKLMTPQMRSLLATEREKAAKAVQKEKQRQMQGYRERKAQTDLRNRIKNLSQEITRRMTKPTERSAVPASLYGVMTQLMDTLAVESADGTKIAERQRATLELIHKLDREYDAIKNSDDYAQRSEYQEEIQNRIKEIADIFEFHNSDTLKPGYSRPTINNLNSTELKNVYDLVRDIFNTMRDANKIIGALPFKDIYEAGVSIGTQQQTLTPLNKASGYERSKRSAMLDNMSVMRAVEMMSGWDRNSTLYQMMHNVEQGVAESDRWTMQYNQALQNLKTGRYEKSYRDALSKPIDYHVTDEDGLAVKMTKLQAIQILLTAEREASNKNLVHLQEGGATIRNAQDILDGKGVKAASQRIRVTPELLQSIRDSLTAWDRMYMQTVRAYFDKEGRAVNRVRYQLHRTALVTEKNYMPYIVDKHYLDATLTENEAMNMWVKSPGSTNQLAKKAPQPVIIDGMETVMARHVKEMGDYIGLAIPIRDFSKVYNSRIVQEEGMALPVKETISKNFGDKGLKLLTQSILEVQGAGRGQSWNTQISQMLSTLQSGFVKAALLVNPSVTIKQAASYIAAESVLSHRALIAGNRPIFSTADASHSPTLIAQIFAAPEGKTAQRVYAEIDRHTSMHYIRRQGMSQAELANEALRSGKVKRWMNNVGASMEQTGVGHAVRKAGEALNPVTWIQRMDVATTAALWVACKEQARMDMKGEMADVGIGHYEENDKYWAHVTELYERVLRETQPMYDSLHRSANQKQHEGLMQFLFPFRTVPIQNHGQLAAAYEAFQASKGKSEAEQKAAFNLLAKTAWAQVESAVVFSLMTFLAAALKRKTKKYRDEDEEFTLVSIGKGIGLDVLNTWASVLFPLMGSTLYDMIDRNVDAFKGKSSWSFNPFSVGVVDMANDLAQAMEKLSVEWGKLMRGESKDGTALWKAAVNLLLKGGKLAGIPADTIKTYAEGIKDNIADIMEGRIPAINNEAVDRSSAVNVGRFLKAWRSGDTEKADAVYEEMVQNYMDGGKSREDAEKAAGSAIWEQYTDLDDAIDAGGDISEAWDFLTEHGVSNDSVQNHVVKRLRERYTDGAIDEQTAVDLLQKYRGLSENDAFWKVQEWEDSSAHSGEEDYSFSKFDRLRDAVAAGDEIDEAVEELLSHGAQDSDVWEAVWKTVGKQLQDGEISEDEAVDKLTRYWQKKENGAYRPVTEDEAWFKVQEILAKGEDGGSWSRYDAIREAIDANKDIGDLVDELVSHGVDQKDINDAVKDHVVQRFVDGKDSEEKLRNYLSRYCGIVNREKVDDIVTSAKYQKETGYSLETLRKGTPYREGDLSRKDAVAYLQKFNGMTKEEAEHRVAAWDYQKEHPDLDIGVESVEAYLFTVSDKLQGNAKASSAYAGYAKSARDMGISPETYDEVSSYINAQSGDGKQERCWEYINSRTDLTWEQKCWWHLRTWSYKTLSKAPWYYRR